MIGFAALGPTRSLLAALGLAVAVAAPATAEPERAGPGITLLAVEVSPVPPVRPVGLDDLTCLTRALYHEARGEGERGMRAVAEVVLNRADSPRFPDTVCAVVDQGSGNGRGCQFSFVCDGSERRRLEPRAWRRASGLAREMLNGAPRSLTDGATHFHATRVNPHWARVYELTAEIGAHRFFRPPLQVAGH
ncbi:MAG: cell wall hydrolase [Alkalilacustris sp.]